MLVQNGFIGLNRDGAKVFPLQLSSLEKVVLALNKAYVQLCYDERNVLS